MLTNQKERGKAEKAVTRRDKQEETVYSANEISYPAPHRKGKGKKCAFFSAVSILHAFYINLHVDALGFRRKLKQVQRYFL